MCHVYTVHCTCTCICMYMHVLQYSVHVHVHVNVPVRLPSERSCCWSCPVSLSPVWGSHSQSKVAPSQPSLNVQEKYMCMYMYEQDCTCTCICMYKVALLLTILYEQTYMYMNQCICMYIYILYIDHGVESSRSTPRLLYIYVRPGHCIL